MGYPTQGTISALNLFAIESKLRHTCTAGTATSKAVRLHDIVAKYSQRKPMMVFCITRKSTVGTAKLLATLWTTADPRDRYWPGPRPGQRIAVKDSELRSNSSGFGAFTCIDLVQIP